MRQLLIYIMVVAMPLYASAYVADAQAITATIEEKLAKTDNPADSILMLENIFDLSFKYRPHTADSIATRVYITARRHNYYDAALDMLRQRANLNRRDDSVMRDVRARAAAFPDGPERTRTLTFIDIQLNDYNANNLDHESRMTRLQQQLRQFTLEPPESPYEKIVLLHSLCCSLSKETSGDLLVEYMDKLSALIDSLPDDELVLRNTFWVQAAIVYSAAGYAEKSIAADLKLLKSMDDMEASYAAKGRPYRFYDANRYIIYTRLLSNWEALSKDDIEEYYRNAIYYRNRDPRAQATYAKSPRADIYYSLAHGDYAGALQLLKGCIDNPYNRRHRQHMLKDMITCARATGDSSTVMSASYEYATMLEKSLSERSQERYRELQIIYDVNEMQHQLGMMSHDKTRSEIRWQRIIITVSLVSILLLLVLVIILVRIFRRRKRLASSLARANDALTAETHNLRLSQQENVKAREAAERANRFKNDFIKSLGREVSVPLKAISEYSHIIVDCTDSTGKPYLQRYADLIDQNCLIINSIASDVLHMAEIDSDTLTVRRGSTDLRHILSGVAGTAALLVKPGVKLRMAPDVPPAELYTDGARLQQILLSVVSNAAKFTTEGSITLDATVGPNGTEISVTDTGIGVPPEQAEHIFGRFVKLDRETPGAGLGLYISRIMARYLGGDLRLDITYRKGARFIVSLPPVPAATPRRSAPTDRETTD